MQKKNNVQNYGNLKKIKEDFDIKMGKKVGGSKISLPPQEGMSLGAEKSGSKTFYNVLEFFKLVINCFRWFQNFHTHVSILKAQKYYYNYFKIIDY